MDTEEVSLPGGLQTGARLECAARLRPLTGVLEERLHSVAVRPGALPHKVSALIAVAVESVGSRPMNSVLAAELCVADRRYLMLDLASRMTGDFFWLTPTCSRCSARFDVGLSRAELPIKVPGVTYPFANAELRGVPVRLRVPNGADQESIASLSASAARGELLRRCILSVAEEPPVAGYVESLTEDEIAVVDAALDDAAPDVGTVLDVTCPECSERQAVAFDPYQHDFCGAATLYEEVHALALHYHWSQAEILSLSRERRRLYLGLIERLRGLHS